METIQDILALGLGRLTLGKVATALAAAAAGWIGARVAERLLRRLVTAVPERTIRHAVLDAVAAPLAWLLRGLGLWAAVTVLPLPQTEAVDAHAMVNRLTMALTVALATWLGVRVIGGFSELWQARAAGTDSTYDDQLVPVVRKTAKVFLVVTGTVMALQNLNYNVGSLLAGLGIGGAALAFASKDTIANFFGSVVIFIDRPFQIGDWVEIGDVEGTVEQVDIRVTRIRTFANSLVMVPNAQMTVTSIQNWSRMRKRRIKLSLGVTYGSTPDQVRAGVAAIRAIIEADDRFLKDFYLVHFNDFGESALEIFCYFFTETTHWAQYMQIREDFLLAVMDAFAGIGLSFAFPTRTVHLADQPPPGAPPAMLRSRPL